jgi:uncharacterized protein (DUF169 family)
MPSILELNSGYAGKMKRILRLRHEPVAVKLIREGEDYPGSCEVPEGQMSHCQAIFRAKDGECLCMPVDRHSCHVGSSALNMKETPEKVASGDYHLALGIHATAESAARMISDRLVPEPCVGEVVCPLAKADFEPDAVVLIDIAERIYWLSALETSESGGRVTYSTSPFQCTCEDLVSIPVVTGRPNISLGCYGCRRRTDMRADELGCGIPYAEIPAYVERLERFEAGVMEKSKRD